MNDGRSSLLSFPDSEAAAQLVAWIESCRELGRGSLRSVSFGIPADDRLMNAVDLEEALDILDRELDNVRGRLQSLTEKA